MKAKKKLSESLAVSQVIPKKTTPRSLDKKQHTHLLEAVDTPLNPPPIKQSEIVAYATAEVHYYMARIDFEERKWRLVRKLYLFADCEPGSYEAKLDDKMRLILVDRASTKIVKTKLPIF
jgi:hypothetical protein